MTPHEFITKWKPSELSERSSYQQHFLDLCDLLGQQKPAEADPKGDWYTFEKGVEKTQGGKGYADVWKQSFFGWEYKGKHKDLKAAYQQLLQYREALGNPPLLVVCDLDRFEIHTNFTDTVKKVHAFALDKLAEPGNLQLLRQVFTNPDALKPGKTRKVVTEEVAGRFARLADALSRRGVPAQRAAHFLMKLMFCMFAEDIDLLPRGLFTRTVANSRNDPDRLSRLLKGLFHSMETGEPFGPEDVRRFNGGLFADSDVIDLWTGEIDELYSAALCDWSSVEPSIFGTLFERCLDPQKRSQIGAHYTGREDIEAVLRPVLLEPLRREWDEARAKADKLWEKVRKQSPKAAGPRLAETKAERDFRKAVADFIDRLAHVTVLDPACGSGNFLYVSIRLLLDLEKEVLAYADAHGVKGFSFVRPTQLLGLEINEYAQQLAQIVIWVGYLQWKHFNGYPVPLDPVLDPFENIRRTDAVLDLSDPEHPKEPEWPAAEFIVGNPPFLGGKKLRAELGDDYVNRLFRLWEGQVRAEADLCCYWFEKARALIEAGKCRRAGLLATQGIRGGANRETLKRIKETGDIFFAESDRDWVLDGAAVHVSMVGFDDGAETQRLLDGKPVGQIHGDLTAGVDVTHARRLAANAGVAFMGDTKGGPFDIAEAAALEMLRQPNPNGRPNSDVVVPWINGLDVTRRDRSMWIIDFGTNATEEQAAFYEAPFEFVRAHVLPKREETQRESYRKDWWRHVRPREDMRQSLRPLLRFIATTTVSKHRLFVWQGAPTLPDHQLITFAFDDDYRFGVLHSRIHEVWALELGTQLEDRPRYTPTTCFETFPFPEPTDAQRVAVAAAARGLDELRTTWLNPPEWTKEEVLTFPGSVGGPWGRYVADADGRGVGTVHYRRRVMNHERNAKDLAKRTLTNLYNQAPAWLRQAHGKLDTAVFAAYGWPTTLTDEEILSRLLELNGRRAAASGGPVRG